MLHYEIRPHLNEVVRLRDVVCVDNPELLNDPNYTAESLRAATNSFANENVTGEGGFGKVYPGELSEMVAINVSSRHGISQHDFDREINLFSGVRHENIVPLLGFCRGPQLLVYGYAPNSDLHHHLHGM
ncbi:putative protein kinase RLK-Pelle-RLCK-IXa family [Helianthus annuus]|nr:putative protein kinase RLK-Pelle-RLCK-IXa family [Helianthus annuus]